VTTLEGSYAGFWIRAAARVVDILVILGIYNLFYLVDVLGAAAGLWASGSIEDLSAFADRPFADYIVRGAFFFGFPPFYYVYLHGAYGQTFGKMALRIKVVNEDGSPLTYGVAFLRWLSYFLCDVTFFLGYLWVAFDKRKQGLHDRVCGTVVIRT
jgi:uncharacterized RDD family membrane protein YckC